MPNDAKLGLVVGVGLVMLVAVLYFRKDPSPNVSSLEPPVQNLRPAGAESGDPRTPASTVSRSKRPTVVPAGRTRSEEKEKVPQTTS